MTTRGQVRVETSPKRVRVLFAGTYIADSLTPLLVWEGPHYPTYYFPQDAVLGAALVETEETAHSPSRGDAVVCDVVVGDRIAARAAMRYGTSPIPELAGTVRFDWAAMDEWLEEDEPVYTHARNPYHRVDILASSRQVTVALDGIELASSRSPKLLFETGLVTRYYLPLSDLRVDLLRPSSTETHCPYKGVATYWSVQVGERVEEDLIWTYRYPLPESQKVAGLACFYNERVDLTVDGVLQPRRR